MAEDLSVPSYPNLEALSPHLKTLALQRTALAAMQAASSLDWALVVLRERQMQSADKPQRAALLSLCTKLLEHERDEQMELARKCMEALK